MPFAALASFLATAGSAVAEGAATAGSAIADGAAAAGNWVADFGENVATGFTGTETGAGDASKKAGIIARDAQGDVQWGNTMARFAGAYARNRAEKKLKESPVLATLYAAGKEGLQ